MNKIEEILQKKEPQNIGELIYVLRKQLGFSRAEVRRKYNETFSEEKTYMTFWRIETGRTVNLKPAMLFGILRILGITDDDFYEYIEKNKKYYFWNK